MRVAGQIIWSSRFLESVDTQRVGGKGGQSVRDFSYSISLAVALCEGKILRVGRIWADGQVLDQTTLQWRLHHGSETQLPDPVIAAIEGQDKAPAYRGTAYIVIEDLDLTPFGNRIPQFNFEVFRRPAAAHPNVNRSPADAIRGVALVPGTGEYALATEPVFFRRGKGDTAVLNVNNDQGLPDLTASLGQLQAELPNVDSVALVVSWFGDDLRCDRCTLQPAVEQAQQDGDPMPWQVAGRQRSTGKVISRVDGRPLFGGTPTDISVVQAIAQLRSRSKSVMFYPFILMDILNNNRLQDPWTGADNQPPVPWRGRITLSAAPGRAGSLDKRPAAAEEVERFFGSAQIADFKLDGETVIHSGPEEWSYRRFILHYAHLCAAAGGVEAFCIGSELRGLTQIRDADQGFPTVRALCALAGDVRSILGAKTKIGYAADWSEYFGYHPPDGSGDLLYHLDPLWSHPDIDFIGIDNYMPLSDWRDTQDHADASAASIYNLSYLAGNVAGGEGYDWYYSNSISRDAQHRLPIVDGAYGEDWVYRYKDLVNWWSHSHENRLGGIKVGARTRWQPESKPIWFTELGCPAVDKGTNQPNVFFDPKSSESFFPYYSSGARDDFIQFRYLQAVFSHWERSKNNPRSSVYGGRMVDMSRAHVWAWDARPWPDFPDRLETWVDGGNYERGHWLNGRVSLASLEEVVSEICGRSDLSAVDVKGLYGALTGFMISGVETARQSLQPLMLAYGFDSFSSGGDVAFASRHGQVIYDVSTSSMVAATGVPVALLTRGPSAETAGRVSLSFVRSDLDYQVGAAEALSTTIAEPYTSQSSLPLVLSEGEAKSIAERWLTEGQIARDTLKFALPPSVLSLGPGDVITAEVDGYRDRYRLDRLDEIGHSSVEAVRIESGSYTAPVYSDPPPRRPLVEAATPVHAEFLDLPLLTGEELPHAPYVAVVKRPWAGRVAVYSAPEDMHYRFLQDITRSAVIGETTEPLPAGTPGLWMRTSLRVKLAYGSLQSRAAEDVLNGANTAAIRYDGFADWEVFQFERAELLAQSEYRLSGFLRGQAGTDGIMPENWPAGSDFVLLDAGVSQLTAGFRDVTRHFRVGPATRAYSDPSYTHLVESFKSVGLRPYKPVHLHAKRSSDNSIVIDWVRRSRIGGDSWSGVDVPLGEERELYHVRVRRGTKVVREYSPTQPRQIYTLQAQIADGLGEPLVFEVAQTSTQFGPGPYERIIFND
jgi:hypothetical protein